MKSIELELLAPARTAETAISAIDHGADAVYIGGPAFGARAAASNSVEDIRRVAEYAHRFHARVYVTLNTIIYPSEIEEVKPLVHELYRAGADALIVQDMAFVEMRDELPPIALHASTQCDIRSVDKAVALADAGFEQLVLPRELSLEETAEIRRAVPDDVELEAFVHGALCVSYSGDCQAGYVACGRSANRGECPQMCRLPYSLTDAGGRELAPVAHYLSLKDLNRLDSLRAMVDAGVSSFKIEGRLKDESYVKNVVAAYSQALDHLVAESRGRYIRRSFGRSVPDFTPDVRNTFNRGYTPYFQDGREGAKRLKMASLSSPKWAGRRVARVLKGPERGCAGAIMVEAEAELHNGDGLTFTGTDGRAVGFRLNRVEGKWLYPASPVPQLKPGMVLYRNVDKAFMDALNGSRTRRRMEVDMELTEGKDPGSIELRLTGPGGITASASAECGEEKAKSPQLEARKRALSKLGESEYELKSLTDSLGERFVAASVLSDLRRRAVEALRTKYLKAMPQKARKGDAKCVSIKGSVLDYHANVANPLARRFYEERGAEVKEEALETQPKRKDALRVMTTRYCLRRELGACLREGSGKLPERRLFLQSREGTPVRYELKFDCERCRMEVWTTGEG